MFRLSLGASLAGCALVLLSGSVQAHGIAGDRVFPATLTIDDPAVGDELSLPTFDTYTVGDPGNANGAGFRQLDYGFEWDKTLTSNFGSAVISRAGKTCR